MDKRRVKRKRKAKANFLQAPSASQEIPTIVNTIERYQRHERENMQTDMEICRHDDM